MSGKIKKIALISPKRSLYEENPSIYEMFERNRDRLKPWLAPPLNLLTIAALTPNDIEVEVIDEHYQRIDFYQKYDLVGITAMTQQAHRAYEIAKEFRKKNIHVVMGGIHASVLPEEAIKHVDTVFVGEAEELWEIFLNDFQTLNVKKIYKRESLYDLSNTLIPKYNLINFSAFKEMDKYYNFIPVQATRGCPHDCNFCLVSKYYGKKIRKKKQDQVIKEIEFLKTINNDSLILFVDDNLFVDKTYAKSLLRALIPLKIRYFAQTDVRVAEDPELLKLAYRSGCQTMLIGFESINIKSLDEVNQNKWKMKQLEKYELNIKKIQQNGIVVFGTFVIGFENDNLSTFHRIRDFVSKNHIPGQFTLLTPIPGSKIYQDLKAQSKLFEEKFWNKCGFYNLVFRHNNMKVEEAEKSLIKLYDDVYQPESNFDRFSYMKNIFKNLPPRWL